MISKTKKQPNLKGLGLKQKSLIRRMVAEKLVVRVIRSEYGQKEDIILQDQDAENDYESVPGRILASFVNRGLVDYYGWMPALSVTIDTFSVNAATKKMISEQELEPSVATEAK